MAIWSEPMVVLMLSSTVEFWARASMSTGSVLLGTLPVSQWAGMFQLPVAGPS